MPEFSITTVAHDASSRGGGIAEVALGIHAGMVLQTPRSRLVCHWPPSMETANVVAANRLGSNITPGLIGDIVHVHGIWTAFEWHACRVTRARGAKLVISPHGSLEPWAFAHKWLKKRVAWWVYQRQLLQNADLLVASSERERRHLRALGLSAPIAVIPNGVKFEQADEYPQENAAAADEKTVLFLSRFSPAKGLPDLVEAWHALRNRHGYRLVIQGFGDPEFETGLRRRIQELDESDNILLRPPVFGVEKYAAYRAASLYVLPSYSENFGITVAEAMISGLPVITTRSTPWDDIEAEGIGWLVTNDVAELSASIDGALKMSPEALAQMGERAKNYARSRFLWPGIIEKYTETYAWLTSRTQAPAWLDR